MAKTCTKDGHKQTTKISTKIQTKRTKKRRTTEEEMEGPTSSGGSRNRLTFLTLQEHDDDDGKPLLFVRLKPNSNNNYALAITFTICGQPVYKN